MSGIAALFHRDGRPVQPHAVSRMAASVSHRGPDGSAVWTCGPVGFGLTLLRTGPGSAAAPVVAVSGGDAAVLDGRIDNRHELRARLALPAALPEIDDAALALRAYQAWGTQAFDRLVGDFAAVIWDERARRLVCARDIAGLKPLYYHATATAFVCGSEMPALFAAAAIDTEPNAGLAAEYLCLRIANVSETLFRDIHRVPPAHVLIVSADRLWTERYYDPAAIPDVHCRSDAEYAERYRSLLCDAIRCRVPDAGVATFYLSGGLDSSSLVALAARMSRTGEPGLDGLETLSMTAPGVHGDESAFIRDVSAFTGAASHEFPIQPPSPVEFAQEVRRYRDLPEEPNVRAADSLIAHARRAGRRVILTGLGGDDWLCAYWSHAADLLARGRFSEFLSLIRADAGGGLGAASRAVLLKAVWPLVPPAGQWLVHRLRGRPSFPEYLTDNLVTSTHLADRLARPARPARRARPAQELTDWLSSGAMMRGHELDDRHHSAFGVEARHPFHDRRVIEFTIGLPEDQRWRGIETKTILRRALAGLLPESVLRRRDKGDYTHTIMAAFDACGDGWLDRLETAERGWVRAEVVRGRYHHMRTAHASGDLRYAFSALRLWMIYALELWLRERAHP